MKISINNSENKICIDLMNEDFWKKCIHTFLKRTQYFLAEIIPTRRPPLCHSQSGGTSHARNRRIEKMNRSVSTKMRPKVGASRWKPCACQLEIGSRPKMLTLNAHRALPWHVKIDRRSKALSGGLSPFSPCAERKPKSRDYLWTALLL